ncbi:MAG TPA: serine hydrolase domain-containing protein [Candidatus Limnocylindria bacterium]|nr:serine hydrolase domain-containing protein [Candidatus Limnocylindria bacterium]
MNSFSRRGFLSTAAIAASPALALGKAPHLSQRVHHTAAETPYWLQATGTPGLAVALLEGGKTREVLCFGSTDAEGKSPVTEATVFQAASLSKQGLLYAALKTIEAGKLDLERPLAQYLDKPYGAEDPDLGRITARHVLTHTTGWPNWLDQGKPVKRLHPPGEQWGYSGEGFIYLQKALEAIWNESTSHYTRRLVLDPLGMTESSFVWRDEYAKSATKGFDTTGKPVNDWRPPESEVSGASSLHTTAREYALLLESYLEQDLRQRHPDVYRQQVAINARLGWSLGWGMAGEVLWQWGDNTEFKAFSALVPARKLGLVILTNGERGMRINREWVNAWLQTDLPAFFLKNVQL